MTSEIIKQQVVSDFQRIKNIPVPYEYLDEGLRNICRAINALPFAVTTERSGDTYSYSRPDAQPDEGFALLNHGHISIAFDEHDARTYPFLTELVALVSKFSELEIAPKPVQSGSHPPGWANDGSGQVLVSEIGYTISVRDDKIPDPKEQLKKMRELVMHSDPNTDPAELQKMISQQMVRAHQIPEGRAESKIQQFRECMNKLLEVARDAAATN